MSDEREKLYRPIFDDGKHLAKDKDGFNLGSTLNDNNNKLSGQARWVEVDPDSFWALWKPEPPSETTTCGAGMGARSASQARDVSDWAMYQERTCSSVEAISTTRSRARYIPST